MFYFLTLTSRGISSLILFSFLVFTFSACRPAAPQQQADRQVVLPESAESGFEVPASNVNLANPLVISQKPEDVALCDKINETIEKSQFSNARWGVIAVSLKDGRVVCGRDARKLFNPASIQKTLTAVVALDKLGEDFRWKTSIYAPNQIQPDGTLGGDLILYGQGAPDFDMKALEQLVADLQAKGLKRVTGNIVGDSSYFRGETIGEGWTWNELQWYYGAEASALTFNGNEGFVSVENGEGRAATDYLQITVAPTPAEKEERKSAGLSRGLEDNNFYMWGSNQNWGARVAVHNPAGWAAKTLKETLEKRGITVDGETKSVDWKSENKLDASSAVELASIQSQTLGEAVKKMNKHSVNLYGELILRTIGKQFGATVPGDIQRPQTVRGDDTAGAAVMKRWLAERRVATDEIQIADGSGLSRLDFVTPEAFARAFIYAAQSNIAPAFTDSLPIAATDGTLGGRLGKAKGKILAKTGTIQYVNSLAGYAEHIDGEVLAFTIIANNDTHRHGAVSAIDAVATMLVKGITDEKETAKEAQPANNNQNVNGNANQPNFVIRNQ